MTAVSTTTEGTCRSCRATVTWVRTEAGRNMPLDIAPVPEGNIVVADPAALPPVVRYLKKGEVAGGDRFVSHFSTCPNADEWRSKGR